MTRPDIEEKRVENDIDEWLKEQGKDKNTLSGPDSKSASPNIAASEDDKKARRP